MRGNEGQGKVDVWFREMAFPIPMRGNEIDNGGLNGIDASAFPIPMRGNEATGSRTVTVNGRGFPIPMRGNELAWGSTK